MARLRVPAACRGGLLSLLGATVIPPPAGIQAAPAPADVAVVVSRGTAEADGWKQVVSALRFRHDAAVIVVDREPQEALPALRELMPRYACFVARPEEAGRVFVQQVSLLSRSLDDQPWGDLQWGIVTGRGPADAMTVARTTAPLVVRKALGGTAMDLGPFREGVWFNEGVRGERTVKSADGTVATRTEDQDTTEAIAAAFRDGPDLFLTSGHATERDWQIGYAFQGGAFRVRYGDLFAVSPEEKVFPLKSPNPKVYLACGNCLMGHVDGPESMAAAMIGQGGVMQLVGYTVKTWFGRAGWGTRDWFLSVPGRWTLSEAFFLNNQTILRDLKAVSPGAPERVFPAFAQDRPDSFMRQVARAYAQQGVDERMKEMAGLFWDRDALVLLGDPTWEARVAPAPAPWSTRLVREGDLWTFAVTATAACTLAEPPSVIFPRWLDGTQVVEGAELEPILTGRFLMVPGVKSLAAGESRTVRFRGVPRGERTPAAPTGAAPGPAPAAPAAAADDAAPRSPAEAAEVAEAVAWLEAHMPARDRGLVPRDFLEEHARWAVRARHDSPWARDVPPEIWNDAVLPYAHVGERRERWRGPLFRAWMPAVAAAPTQEAAVRMLNERLWKENGITFHATKRPKTDQSVAETMDAGCASCTGMSIMLANACRACGIPARLAGVPLWLDDSGNHTWVEVWDGGAWRAVDAFAPAPYGEAWWTERTRAIAAARPAEAKRRIWAVTWEDVPARFPVAWDPGNDWVRGVDVTERYAAP